MIETTINATVKIIIECRVMAARSYTFNTLQTTLTDLRKTDEDSITGRSI